MPKEISEMVGDDLQVVAANRQVCPTISGIKSQIANRLRGGFSNLSFCSRFATIRCTANVCVFMK
ncbi:MAG: hypothetical protein DME18_17235 [Verrucomicrobia bacterium]|nr:MAG: hypothetical protein DME18_17235 [Verrucomicrobiota bacterium]